MSAAPTTPAPATGPPSLSTTATVTTLGTLAWVGWAWAIGAALLVAILVPVSVWGELEESLWHQLGGGAQRWLFAAVGFTMISEFGRMFLLNGVTRAQLARSALAAGAVLCPLGGIVLVAGYGLERVAFDINDWSHVVTDLGRSSGDAVDPLGSVTTGLRLFGEHLLTLAAFFVTGWLIGIAYRSLPRDEAHLYLLPCLVPAAVAQLLVPGESFVFGFLDGLDIGSNPWIGAAITMAVVAFATTIAVRLTRRIVL